MNLIKKYTSLALIFCILLTNIYTGMQKQVKAAVDTSNWVITNMEGGVVRDQDMIFVRTHKKAEDNVLRYWTDSYRMSRPMFDLNSPFTSGSNAAINAKEIAVVQSNPEIIGDQARVKYTINKDDFLNIATDKKNGLGITALDVRSGNGIVFLNPVYDTYYGDNPKQRIRDQNIWGLQEFLSVATWSQTTADVMYGRNGYQSPYNVWFKISESVLYKINTEAVYKNGSTFISLSGAKNSDGATVTNPLRTEDGLVNTEYNYSVSTANKTLIKEGITYKLKKYQMVYTKGGSVITGQLRDYVSNPATITEEPNADPGSTATVYLIYEPDETPVKYNVQVVAEKTDKKKLKTLLSGETVTGGKTFTHTVGSKSYTLTAI